VKVKFCLAFLLLASFAAVSKADGSSITYNYLGTMSFTSASNAAITETITFDFNVQYVTVATDDWISSIVGPSYILSTGPITDISGINAPPIFGQYIALFDAAGNNFDLQGGYPDEVPPVIPTSAYVYACGTAACQSNFYTVNPFNDTVGIFYYGTESVLVTEVPEPPALRLALIGLALVAIIIRYRRTRIGSAG
jgi:hypothetical protein